MRLSSARSPGTRWLRVPECSACNGESICRSLHSSKAPTSDQMQIAVMVAAYEAAMRELDLTAHSPGAVTVAKTIVMLATQGERDPVRLRKRAIEIISGLPSDVA